MVKVEVEEEFGINDKLTLKMPEKKKTLKYEKTFSDNTFDIFLRDYKKLNFSGSAGSCLTEPYMLHLMNNALFDCKSKIKLELHGGSVFLYSDEEEYEFKPDSITISDSNLVLVSVKKEYDNYQNATYPLVKAYIENKEKDNFYYSYNGVYYRYENVYIIHIFIAERANTGGLKSCEREHLWLKNKNMLYDYFTLISNSYFTKTKEAKELFVEQETPKKYTMKYQYEKLKESMQNLILKLE